jgi:hypothetical protein
MCPACIGAAVLYFAGTTSAGGIAVLALKSARATRGKECRGKAGSAENRQSFTQSRSADSMRS